MLFRKCYIRVTSEVVCFLSSEIYTIGRQILRASSFEDAEQRKSCFLLESTDPVPPLGPPHINHSQHSVLNHSQNSHCIYEAELCTLALKS